MKEIDKAIAENEYICIEYLAIKYNIPYQDVIDYILDNYYLVDSEINYITSNLKRDIIYHKVSKAENDYYNKVVANELYEHLQPVNLTNYIECGVMRDEDAPIFDKAEIEGCKALEKKYDKDYRIVHKFEKKNKATPSK